MNLSINFSSKRTGKGVGILLLALTLQTGCAAMGKDVLSISPTPVPFEVQMISPDRPAPQAAQMTTIRWSASATGGVGDRTFEFVVSDGKEEKRVHAGSSSSWDWRPEAVGTYKVKVAVRDSLGNRAESGWSVKYIISKKILYTVPIAVMPVENLSGTTAPLKEIMGLLIESLEKRGFTLLDEKILKEFMARHRIRYTGGIDMEGARLLKEETGAGAVLITSLELYDSIYPPKIAVMSRLVSTEGSGRRILWMDGIGLSGDSSPGILGLGLVKDPKKLAQTVVENISDSLAGYLSGDLKRQAPKGIGEKFPPRMQYGSLGSEGRNNLGVAVIPFYNLSSRRNAGEVMSLQFVRHLIANEHLSVVEPGDVRMKLLNYRVILEDGISLANADLISNRLQVDLILTGRVFDYQDYRGAGGAAKVDFSVLVLEEKSRKIVWYSRSSNKGDDRVYLFDWGKRKTANDLANQMVGIVVNSFVSRELE